MPDEYYEISPQLNDIDFYIGESKAESSVQIASQVEASAGRIANASSSIAIASSFSAPFLRKIIEIQSSIAIEVVKEVTPLEVLNVLTIIHIQSDVVSSTQKITTASSSIDITSSVSVPCQKITRFLSEAHISSSTSVNAKKITRAASISAISISSNFNTKLIANIRISLPINIRSIVKSPIRLSPSYIDDTSIRTLFTLDNNYINYFLH